MLQRKAQMLDVLGRRRGTGVLALLICGAAWLGMAQAAQAGDLTRSGTQWSYTENNADGGANSFNIDYCLEGPAGPCSPNRFIVVDDSDSMNVAPDLGCHISGVVPAGTEVGCPVVGNDTWFIALGGGNDALTTDARFTERAGAVFQQIIAVGGPGNDFMDSGDGNDLLLHEVRLAHLVLLPECDDSSAPAGPECGGKTSTASARCWWTRFTSSKA